MLSNKQGVFVSLIGESRNERMKIVLFGVIFFCIISSYTIIKELKDSIFMGIIGSEKNVPYAKLMTLFCLWPLVLFYSKMVDRMRRYQLLSFFSIIYSVLGFVCAYFIGHPTIGLANSVAHSSRVFGWVYFFFVESFSPFVVSVFWAFLNSVSSPSDAKKNYGLLISASKLGGMLSAGIAWFLLAKHTGMYGLKLSHVEIHQMLMILSSILLMIVPFVISYLVKKVPASHMHGYEAAYQFEKHNHTLEEKHKKDNEGILSGLIMLFRYPYALGMFAIVFFYEIISAIIGYMRLGIAHEVSNSVSECSCFLFKSVFFVHFLGLIISLFGTRVIMQILGERLSLMVMPISMGILLFYLLVSSSPMALVAAFVALRSIYYAFNQPVSESLYIPTVKTIKFKTKAWIDTFGKKVARSTGSGFNILITKCSPLMTQVLHGSFFGILVILWVFVSYALGSRYDKAVKNNEVIGSDNEM